jgi:hypothetical protein
MSNYQKITDVKSVAGIDALYYQLIINITDYIEFYLNAKENNFSRIRSFNKLSQDWEKEYTFFQLDDKKNNMTVCQVGFKNLNTNDGKEFVKIQLSSSYFNTFGITESITFVNEKLEEIGLVSYGTKITRIDLNTYVYGYDFSYLEYDYFKTLTRKHSNIYGESGNVETFELGSRSNTKAPFLRIYNKWLELKQNDKKEVKQAIIQYKFYKKYGVADLNYDTQLWNVEFELKRDFLKRFEINSVEDCLSSVNTIHNYLMQDIKLMNKKYKTTTRKAKDTMRISPIWNLISKEYNFNNSDYPRNKIKTVKHIKDENWLSNRIEEYLSENPMTNDPLQLQYIQKLKDVLELGRKLQINSQNLTRKLKQQKNDKY